MWVGLNQNGRIMAEYVWLGGSTTVMGGFDLRSKTKSAALAMVEISCRFRSVDWTGISMSDSARQQSNGL